MWDDHRLLNGIANGLYAVAALLILYGVLMAIMRLPIFPLREVEVTGRISHTTRDQVQTIVAEHLEGNFFTLDLEAARAAFQRLPWVRQANVRREWPDRLDVEIEEHVAVARWRDTALVNTFGEVFQAASNQTLPVFIAPDGTSAEVTQRYEAFKQQLARLDKLAVQVQLSQRTAIHHQLTNRSATGDREQVNFVTTFLADGSLFYYVTVVPANESNAYAGTFRRIAESIRLTDR